MQVRRARWRNPHYLAMSDAWLHYHIASTDNVSYEVAGANMHNIIVVSAFFFLSVATYGHICYLTEIVKQIVLLAVCH